MNRKEIIAKIEGIKSSEHPTYESAFISEATYRGNQLNELEIERLNQDVDYVFEQVELSNISSGYSFGLNEDL